MRGKMIHGLSYQVSMVVMFINKYDFTHMVVDSDNEPIRRFTNRESAKYFAENIGGKVKKIDWLSLIEHEEALF